MVCISYYQETDFDIHLIVQNRFLLISLNERCLTSPESVLLYSGRDAGILKSSFTSTDIVCFPHQHQWLVLNIEPIFYWLGKLWFLKEELFNEL